jgi:8-amino-7-oxononanoate synthase
VVPIGVAGGSVFSSLSWGRSSRPGQRFSFHALRWLRFTFYASRLFAYSACEQRMTDFDQELGRRLAAIREAGLYRELRRVDSPQSPRLLVGGRELVNFSSNDYLGLANEPALKEAAKRAIDEFGAGSGAARLICGSLAPHHELEEALAAFKGTAAALSFSSGYATALGTLGALLGREDMVVLDKLVHASLVDAARLCGAKLRIFKHNDLADLEGILKWASGRPRNPRLQPANGKPRALVVTESVFSMDGDLAPLKDLVELKDRYGAWLMLDEAHATGLFGGRRRGLAEAFGVAERVEIQMGTLGKALGAAGGYICGSRALVDLLINRARSFIFSTAPTPATVAAATAGIWFLQTAEGEARRVRLWQRVDELKNALVGGPWAAPVVRSAILPLLVGAEGKAVEFAAALHAEGIFVPAIRYPTVARGQARLRCTVTAAHSAEDVARLAAALTHRQAPPATHP